ncbi:haloacid dehalogenase type II [Brevibacterium sp.]|uniref:haloacid dehalogenase type II n=1 Tax=Brevibacterium sp. TaxID=1701 RepID=UPI0028117C6F|nr:haloacid dehalogenase type II [Brevibacterium sp.]
MAQFQIRPEYVSFDNYGTLISWHMNDTARELTRGQLDDEQFAAFTAIFRRYRYDAVLGDYLPYDTILQNSFDRACKRHGIESTPEAGTVLGEAVASWGAHDGIVEPLTTMGKNYKLVILSNGDDWHLNKSVARLGADFHAVLTAEQAQSYKPRYQAFEYMLETLNARPEDFLHVSSHTRYDLIPADDLGFTNKVYFNRGFDPHARAYNYRTVASLGEVNAMLGL